MPIVNCKIHPSVKIWHRDLVNLYDSIIDEGSIIAAFVEIGGARIGKYCKIGCQAYICPNTVIEDHVFISHGTRFCNIKKPIAYRSQKSALAGSKVQRGATIGAGAIILPNIVIGENTFVGAGSVVTRNVESGITVVGNPARPIRHSGEYETW